MNAKLTVLYKEMPWLKTIADEIGNPSVVKVKRLDATSITRWTGQSVTCDDSYWIDGYFFDRNGTLMLRIVPEKPVGIIAHIKRWAQARARVTIEDALRRYTAKDAVRYVVLFGHHLDDYGQLSLYVYKMPEGITTSEFLRNIEEERVNDATQKLQAAAAELSAELSEAEKK
jgi:hypothetical protein